MYHQPKTFRLVVHLFSGVDLEHNHAMTQRLSQLSLILLIFITFSCHVSRVEAFCGMYVSSKTDEKLLNDATHVVLFRQGTTTSVTMQNHYKGQVEDFAMLVPVPQVLQPGHVNLVPLDHMERLARHSMPRLVEYDEQVTCSTGRGVKVTMSHSGRRLMSYDPGDGEDVLIRQSFAVGEYDIEILEARESTSLLAWLEANGYNIPDGGEELLQGYINTGMYFFVAKVDASKVKFDEEGEAMLSPLKFTYESEDFSLPVRLGMLNADGPQDLLIHIISEQGRFDVKNYRSDIVPTNLILSDRVRGRFHAFYKALFQTWSEAHNLLFLTEYTNRIAWDHASTVKCDPCTIEPIAAPELLQSFVDDPDATASYEVLTSVRDIEASGFLDGVEQALSERTLEGIARSCHDAYYDNLTDQRSRSHKSTRRCVISRRGAHRWRVSCEEASSHEVGAVRQCLNLAMTEALSVHALMNTTPGSGELSFEIRADVTRTLRFPGTFARGLYTLTRIRGRLDPEEVREDIVFKRAHALRGGYGQPRGRFTTKETPELEEDVAPILRLGMGHSKRPQEEVPFVGGFGDILSREDATAGNMFQARYVVMNPIERDPESLCEKGKRPAFSWGSNGVSPSIHSAPSHSAAFSREEIEEMVLNARDAAFSL